MKFIFLLLVIVCFALAGSAQTPDPETTEADVYLAKDDGDGSPGDAATVFSISDIPIHCVVKLGSPDPATVKMYLVAVSVKGVKAESRVVSASYRTKNGQNEVYFNGRPEKNWNAGSYRADIFVDGKPFRSIDFVVTSPVAADKGNAFAPKSAISKPRNKRIKGKVN